GDNDLAVAVDDHAVGEIIGGADGGGHDAAAVEGSVEGAIRVVAGQGEVVVGGVAVVAGDDDLAAVVDGDGMANIRGRADGGGHDAGAVETSVEAAILVVAHHGEVLIASADGITGHDDLAAAVDGDAIGEIIAGADGGGHDAADTEGTVESAIR